MTDFQSFQQQRTHVNDINEHGLFTSSGEPQSGYIYGDLGYIEDTEDGKFYTIAERSELITGSLSEAERWLFDHWVKYL